MTTAVRHLPRSVDLVQVRAWSEALCRLDATDPVRVVGALGIGPAPAAWVHGVGRVVPPPAGTTACVLGVVDGRFRCVEITWRAPSLTRGALEDAFGTGTTLRRTRPLGPWHVAHRVVVPDAPFTCDVVAVFARPPKPHAVADGVVLRRRRAVHRPLAAAG